MSKSNLLENDLLEKMFKNTTIPWDANTNLFVSLHTADPGEAGTQLTSEANYTSYARATVSRSGTGWTVTGNQVVNAALVQLPLCTGGSSVCTHFAVGTAASGAGQILYKGALSSSLSVSNGIQPQFNAGALVITED
ncbi:MAG: hypothetical protein ACK5Z2_07825 [Bacteroidota bacterium]|jgi:hypothetical protein